MMVFGNTIVLLEGVITGGNKDSVTSGGNSAVTTEVGTAPAAPAPAAGEEQAAGPMSWLPMVLIYGGLLVALWFFMLRPQRKRAKQMKDMQESMKAGDNVVTSSGFFGKVVGIGEDSFLVEFGDSRGVRIWVRKSDISGTKAPVMTPPPTKES